MALYYFDFFDTEDVAVTDTEGTELPDFIAARDEAVLALTGLANDIKPTGPYRKLDCKVRNGNGREIWHVSVQLEVQQAS